ncbi:Glycoside hydrolase, family 47 [Senna tora]|uniref:Glycoside hydrolase, family 47 n=1 Tax=Senna tora TaxID=362788 RepID=A0A835CBF3_9FABA|nr:Glycoside hydrolase, family 47 [Senna tora]
MITHFNLSIHQGGTLEEKGSEPKSYMLGLTPGGNPNQGFYTLDTDADVTEWLELHSDYGCPNLVIYGVEGPNEDDIFASERAVATVEGERNEQPLMIVENIDSIDLTEFNEQPLNGNEMRSPRCSDDEGNNTKWPEFNEDVDMGNPRLEVGMEFKNASVFRKALIEYCVNEGVDFKWKRNTKHKLSAHCTDDDCGWKIYASNNPQTGTLKFNEDFTENPNWKLKNVKNSVRKKISVDISLSKAYRAKRKAKEALEGSESEQYSRLWDYAETIKSSNPGSCVKIQCETPEGNGPTLFKRMYVRFHAQKVGFLSGCRPIIGLDACHLKGRYGGQLIAAIGRDGNENMIPIAIAVVEQENRDSWTWFLECFSAYMGDPEEMGFVFVSDRQKGLVEVFGELYPTVDHRYCMRHMYANFKQKHKGKELRDAMWECAFATTPRMFEAKMEKVKKLSMDAYEDLSKVNPKLWSWSHYCTRALCDDLTNNVCESFNSYIGEARDKPIISMLECIRLKLMKRFYVKFTGMDKFGGPYCPNALDTLEKIKIQSRNCFSLPSGRLVYEVECVDGNHVVDLNTRNCTCRMWSVSGIPCKHAVAAIQFNKQKPEEYLHKCYSKEMYLRTCSETFNPMPGEALWIVTGLPQIKPPLILRPPGRPKKLRRRAADEPRPHDAEGSNATNTTQATQPTQTSRPISQAKKIAPKKRNPLPAQQPMPKKRNPLFKPPGIATQPCSSSHSIQSNQHNETASKVTKTSKVAPWYFTGSSQADYTSSSTSAIGRGRGRGRGVAQLPRPMKK